MKTQATMSYGLPRGIAAALICLIFVSIQAPSSHAQEVSNKGREFLMTFLGNYQGSATIELHLTGANTTVTVEYPMGAPTFTETVTITDDDITIVELPTQSSSGWSPNAVGANAVYAYAETDFVAYMINRQGFTSDAALALPVDAMNTEYIVMTYTSVSYRNEFAVVAGFDNTVVSITPTAAIGDTAPGETLELTLNRGEAFFARSNSTGAAGDLTGTIISASRPVGMTNGNQCVNVPVGTGYCDHVFEVAHPTQTWGESIPVTNLPNRTEGSVYRIIASTDDTEVTLDGTDLATLNRGEFFETQILPGDHVFTADKPIFVVQFMTGSARPGTGGIGDPAMGNMIPSEQYLNAYTFSTVGGNQFRLHYLTVIAHVDDIGVSMMLDGSLIPAGEFSPISGTDLSVARLQLEEGTHTTSSAGLHGITVQGYNNDDSYLYPGGARFEFITGADENPPICAFTIEGNDGVGSVRDDRVDDSGVYFVRLAEGSENVELTVDPFEPGAAQVGWRLSLVDASLSGAGVVVGIDGSGNQCRSTVQLGDDQPPLNECDDITTMPQWDGQIHSNGDGTGWLRFTAQTGLTRVHFYNTTNLSTDLSAEGFVETADNDWTWDGEPGEEPTEVIVQLETIDKTSGSIRFWVRLHDTCQRTVDVDPMTDLGREVMLPTSFALEQNYPNPFNPSTSITYHLPEALHVTLVVYDVAGREVRTLVDAALDAGMHTVTWDGTAQDGRAVGSGIYLYRIEAGEYTKTHKMTLIK